MLRKDDRYELTDRTGHSVGEVPLSTIVNLVRQGRLFRTDKVRKNGGPMQPLGELQEFEDLFRELLPEAFQVDGSALRPAPELSGEVDTLTVAELFARLYREKRTGRLFLCESDRHQEKVIVFRQGVAISAMSNLEEEWLGELLISQGLIDAQAFEEAVALRKQNGSRIGSALVYLEKLSPRELRRALSVQAMERLLNAFRMRSGTFQFVADESAGNEEILLVASPRDIIETGLSAALEAREVAEQLTSYGDPVFRVEVPPDFATELSEVDVQILRVLERGRPLSTCIETIAQLGRLTTAEARLRVLALMVFGVLHVGGAEVEALDKIVGSLQTMDYFRLLDVRRAASPDEITTAFRRKMVEYHGQPTPGDSAAVQRTRERIAATLERARATLSNPEVRPLYERALQLGLDYHQPEVRQRLEHEQLVAKGRALLAQQAYQEAFETFARAAGLMPDDARIFTQIGWARFLASDHGKEAAAEAIADVERALRVTGDQDEAYMTIGKIHRLSGDLAAAEDYLRRSIELNPHNNEAQSELRLLFTRELQRGGPKIKIDLSSAAGAGAVLGVAVVVLALL
ncbi:MAG: DUF4388 domain-containing protein, partial [Myxococcales bacterium]|nr:DUF4388 domain-containing protein [Myxococcales bacterium]